MSVVKGYQHRKAIGNARSTVRGLMLPVLRDVDGGDDTGQATTDYGPEKVTVGSTIEIDPVTGEGILAVGRLERLSNDAVERDVRLANVEAYTLYWLPYAWTHIEGDYHGNPQKIGDEINPGVTSPSTDFVTAGSRVWIVLEAESTSDLAGEKAFEFVVVESYRNGVADLVEYEATVYRSEGIAPRTVIVTP